MALRNPPTGQDNGLFVNNLDKPQGSANGTASSSNQGSAASQPTKKPNAAREEALQQGELKRIEFERDLKKTANDREQSAKQFLIEAEQAHEQHRKRIKGETEKDAHPLAAIAGTLVEKLKDTGIKPVKDDHSITVTPGRKEMEQHRNEQIHAAQLHPSEK